MKTVIGYILLLLPFAGIFAFVWKEASFKEAVGIFLVCALVVGAISLGVFLIH